MGEREQFATLRRPKPIFAWRDSSFASMVSRRAVHSSEGGSALGGLAVVHEEVLIVRECVNANFKKGNIHVETVERGWITPLNRRDAVREK